MPPTAPKKVVTKSTANLQQFTPSKILGTIPFTASTKITLAKLDRTMMVRSYNLRITGSITTTATSTTANIQPGDEWGAVLLIELVANGGNVLRSITGEQLCIANYLLQGYIKQINTLSGAAGTYAFDSTLPLWMLLPGNIGKALDTTLNTTLLSDLYIRITWGSNLSINGVAGTTISATTQVEVSADQAFFLNRSAVPSYAMVQLQNYQLPNVPPTGAGTAGYPWQVPVGQTYPFWLLNVKNTGTLQDSATGLAGNLVIQSGNNQMYNVDMSLEAQMNNFRNFIPFSRFTDFLNNTFNLFAGWRLIRFVKQQYLSESLNLINFQNCTAYIQNSASGQNVDFNLIPLQIFPASQVIGQ